ncbi:MAG TPA: dTDP-4-dehydrorhamnose 3,5-epimerase family protein [bacterium]|jgi:dTDP-4-dehydrorhamnose 3,5-epimerase|nr:dTDP-4-dehydrorhamnose 3,5-epimerase family protein [bacterium]HOG38037.1 dTDP-4-dehydrorhamnose 3,5-epimerase family protein [bacterium]
MELFKGLVIKRLEKYEDPRGWLCEVYREDEINYAPELSEDTQSSIYKPVMSYVSVTNPGISRGPHEHKHQSDCFVFIGPGDFMLYLWDNRGGEEYKKFIQMKIKVGETNPTCVIVPPGIIHGYKCISEKPAWSINLPDKLYKGPGKIEEVDEVRWENMENSPFKID